MRCCRECGKPIVLRALGEGDVAPVRIERAGEEWWLCEEHATPPRPRRVKKKVGRKAPDPLVGQREAINAGKDSALFPPSDEPPVRVGDIFELRSCGVEVVKLYRVVQRGKYWRWWRAELVRLERERKPYFLGPSGYVHDAGAAVKTTDSVYGEVPEGETVPPQEVGKLPSTLEARLRYLTDQEQVQAERIRQRDAEYLTSEIRELVKRALKKGADPTPLLAPIAREIERQHKGLSDAA